MEFTVRCEEWPLRRPFTIARETMSSLPLVYLTIHAEGFTGHAEAAGVDYHGERTDQIASTIAAYLSPFSRAPDRAAVLAELPPGGARNAIDCALWDLEAKSTRTSVTATLGDSHPRPVPTLYTLSLDTPDNMAASLVHAPADAVLKLKLGGGDGQDLTRVTAVRAAAPLARLVVDINGGWSLRDLQNALEPLAALGVELIEQPLAPELDAQLLEVERIIPICADESVNTVEDLDRLDCYDGINIKLDKTGGLTAALELAEAALARGKLLMVGSMVGTSLGMAPAFQVAHRCAYADLDGPLLLASDRPHAMQYDGCMVHPPVRELWG